MAISTQIYVKDGDLALTPTIRSLPQGTIEVVSDAGTDPENEMYFFRVEDVDFDRFESLLGTDHTVADFDLVVAGDGRRTYRISYAGEAKLITPMINEIGGLTLDSESHEDGWLLTLQLEGHEALYELDEFAREEGIDLEVLELQQREEPDSKQQFGLTEPQAEALVAAFEHGYYDDPREMSLEELASLLDISQTAASGRLRRGSCHHIEEVLIGVEN